VADTLATRGVKGSTYCPINSFDQLPPNTETEDDPSIPDTEVITQTEEFGADEIHLPEQGIPAIVYGFNEEEAEERERGIRHFLYEQCDNSSTPVTDDEGFSNTGETVVIPPRATVVDDGSEPQERPQEPGFSFQIGHVGAVDMPESGPHHLGAPHGRGHGRRRSIDERWKRDLSG
jgi:hypothetical protein